MLKKLTLFFLLAAAVVSQPERRSIELVVVASGSIDVPCDAFKDDLTATFAGCLESCDPTILFESSNDKSCEASMPNQTIVTIQATSSMQNGTEIDACIEDTVQSGSLCLGPLQALHPSLVSLLVQTENVSTENTSPPLDNASVSNDESTVALAILLPAILGPCLLLLTIALIVIWFLLRRRNNKDQVELDNVPSADSTHEDNPVEPTGKDDHSEEFYPDVEDSFLEKSILSPISETSAEFVQPTPRPTSSYPAPPRIEHRGSTTDESDDEDLDQPSDIWA